MMRSLRAPGLLAAGALCALLTGCYETPFRVTIDGTLQTFNSGVRPTATRQVNVYHLAITGRNDPVPNAVDDESALALAVDIDAAALPTLPRDTPLTVRGATAFPSNDQLGGGPSYESLIAFTPGEGHHAAVQRVSLTQYSFAPRAGGEAQQWSGTMTVHDVNATTLRFSFDLAMEGTIPYRDSASSPSRHVTIVTEVEAPAAP